MRKKFYALGRLKTGQMNKTESAYAKHLDGLVKSGDVVWYKFECMKFRLADNTFYTPDFAVMLNGGEIQLHEVKGVRTIFQDDAKVKIKVAAELFPFSFVAAFPVKGGGWEFDCY